LERATNKTNVDYKTITCLPLRHTPNKHNLLSVEHIDQDQPLDLRAAELCVNPTAPAYRRATIRFFRIVHSSHPLPPTAAPAQNQPAYALDQHQPAARHDNVVVYGRDGGCWHGYSYGLDCRLRDGRRELRDGANGASEGQDGKDEQEAGHFLSFLSAVLRSASARKPPMSHRQNI
jgi:hypothetical protein